MYYCSLTSSNIVNSSINVLLLCFFGMCGAIIKASVTIFGHFFWWTYKIIFVGYIPKNELVLSQGICLQIYLYRYYQTLFKNFKNLKSHYQQLHVSHFNFLT